MKNISAASQKERAGIDFVELAMSLTGSSRLSAAYVYKNYNQLFLRRNCFREYFIMHYCLNLKYVVWKNIGSEQKMILSKKSSRA